MDDDRGPPIDCSGRQCIRPPEPVAVSIAYAADLKAVRSAEQNRAEETGRMVRLIAESERYEQALEFHARTTTNMRAVRPVAKVAS